MRALFMMVTPVDGECLNYRGVMKFRDKGTIPGPYGFHRERESMMMASDILKEDVSDFASRLEAMTTDEVFVAMRALEEHSEAEASDRDETGARIALVEDEIERRFPGQLLAPYRDWKKEPPLLS